MKRLRFIILAIFLILVTLLFSGCEKYIESDEIIINPVGRTILDEIMPIRNIMYSLRL